MRPPSPSAPNLQRDNAGFAPKKILFVSHEYPPLGGGAGKALFEFARRIPESRVLTLGCDALNDRGIQVLEVRPRHNDLKRGSLLKMALFGLSAFLRLVCMNRKNRPEVIVAFFTLPGGFTALLAHLFLKIPYAVWLRGGDVPGFTPRTLGTFHHVLLPLIHLIWKKARWVLSNGPYLRSLAGNSLPGLRVMNIPNGIQGTDYQERPSYPLRVVFASRLVPEQKGVEDLPGIWDALRSHFSAHDPQLEIIGDGPSLDFLKRVLPEKQVSFTGWIPRQEILRRLRETHLYLHLSSYEGISNGALEALEAGCVLLTNIAPCNRWLLEAPGAFTDIRGFSLSDFSRLSRANHLFARRYDWEQSLETLRSILKVSGEKGPGIGEREATGARTQGSLNS